VLRIGQTYPATKASSAGVDRERTPLCERQGGGPDFYSIEGQLEFLPVQ
jgi:hypothetical protein